MEALRFYQIRRTSLVEIVAVFCFSRYEINSGSVYNIYQSVDINPNIKNVYKVCFVKAFFRGQERKYNHCIDEKDQHTHADNEHAVPEQRHMVINNNIINGINA
jgi:hypothetical protein